MRAPSISCEDTWPLRLRVPVSRGVFRMPSSIGILLPVYAMPPMLAQIAVVLAALPTGTGPYTLAEFHEREAHVTSRAILLSTLGAVVSPPVLFAIARHV